MHSATIVIQTVTRMFVDTGVWSRIRGSIHIVVLNSVFCKQRSSSSPTNVLFLLHSHPLCHHLNKRRTQKNMTRKWISSQRKMPQIQRNPIKELFRYAREIVTSCSMIELFLLCLCCQVITSTKPVYVSKAHVAVQCRVVEIERLANCIQIEQLIKVTVVEFVVQR